MRYDRARRSLDRHATYIVATFVAGASRQPTRGADLTTSVGPPQGTAGSSAGLITLSIPAQTPI